MPEKSIARGAVMNGSPESLTCVDVHPANPIILTDQREEWRTINDFPNYAVSSLGRVKRITRAPHTRPGKILLPKYGEGRNREYLRVTLYKNGKRCLRFIHRIMLLEFVGPCPPGHNCNHEDGIKSRNVLDNIGWVTFSENSVHAVKTGLMKGKPCETNSMAKLKNEEVQIIKKLLKEKVASKSSIAWMFRVSPTAIRDIEKGRRWGSLPESRFIQESMQ